MNSNPTHLGVLLARFELSNRSLADMLNVHYSLVSKWLNLKRPLKINSPHMKKLIEVLFSIDKPTNLSTLKLILRDTYPDADLSEKEKIAVYLAQYLSSGTDEAQKLTVLENVKTGRIDSIAKMDIYSKHSGRRDALMRLLDTAIALPSGQELLLFSQEDLSWHMGNEDFRSNWLEKYRLALQKGNRITMVHTVDRKVPHLLYTITQWLPLHLTGKTNAFYFPEYSDAIFRPSILLLRGHASLLGMTVNQYSEGFNTYYTTDEFLVKQLEIMFSALLSQCRPIFEELGGGNITRKLLEAAQRPQTSYNFSPLPLVLALDTESFSGLLQTNGVDGKRFSECCDYFSKYRSYILDTIKRAATNQILDLAALEAGMREGIQTSEFNWIVKGNLFVSPEYFKRGIDGLCAVLSQNANLTVALTDDDPLPNMGMMSLLIRENTVVTANSRVEDTPCPLIMREPTIVRTFFQHFERFWASIPRIRRDKESVLHRLKQLLV